jgi:multidrug efflux pump subunit AcrB
MPIALALGAGAHSRMPMGIVVVGGLLFALILTLFVVPAMYVLMATNKVSAEINEDPLIN